MVTKTSLNQPNDEESLIGTFFHFYNSEDAFKAFGGKDKNTGCVNLKQMTDIIENEFNLEVNVKVIFSFFLTQRNFWRPRMLTNQVLSTMPSSRL